MNHCRVEHEVIRSVSLGKSRASASPGKKLTRGVRVVHSSPTHSSISRQRSFSNSVSGCKVFSNMRE